MSISRAEWTWLVSMTLIILCLTQIPPTLARLMGPQDRVHVGSYWYAGDFSQYLAAMREGAASPSWLVHNHFSAEPHAPVLMYPLYVGIGKLASATGLPMLAIYAAVEQAMRVLLAASLYVFAALLLADVGARRFAFLVAALSGGVGVPLAVGAGLVASEGGPDKINTYVEAVTFGAFLAAPHVGLGMAATLGAIVLFAAAGAPPSPTAVGEGGGEGSPHRGLFYAVLLLLGLDVLVLALLHPFNLPVLLAAFAVYAGIRCVAERRLATRPLARCAVAGVVGAPIVLYNFATFTFDPFWSATYGAQNVMPSPRPWEVPIDYGVVFLVALLGLWVWRTGRTEAQTIFLVWVAVGALAMYAPVPYQRRFAFGLQPGLAVLAALGWPLARRGALALVAHFKVPERRQRGIARRLVVYPFVILGFTGTLASYLAITAAAASNQPVSIYMVDRDTYAAGQWIAETSGPDDVVLGSFNAGNALAGVLPGRVVLGYDVASLHAAQKKKTIAALYRGEVTEEDVRAFLREHRISYIVVGPEERKLGAHDPAAGLGLSPAVTVGSTLVYRVSQA